MHWWPWKYVFINICDLKTAKRKKYFCWILNHVFKKRTPPPFFPQKNSLTFLSTIFFRESAVFMAQSIHYCHSSCYYCCCSADTPLLLQAVLAQKKEVFCFNSLSRVQNMSLILEQSSSTAKKKKLPKRVSTHTHIKIKTIFSMRTLSLNWFN